MANTLGLDDDLDGVELVRDSEKAFEIKIANNEAERLLTVGQLYDLLLSKIPVDDAQRKCASAMSSPGLSGRPNCLLGERTNGLPGSRCSRDRVMTVLLDTKGATRRYWQLGATFSSSTLITSGVFGGILPPPAPREP